MNVYVFTMCSLSFFGFSILFFSLYLLVTVPTKLTPLTQFIIHGHDVSSGIAQLYLTLGLIPSILFPCASGYMNGLFTYLNIMSTLDQLWTQVVLVAINGSFSLLLTINRVFAVTLRIPEKLKKLFFQFFLVAVIGVLSVLTVAGLNMRPGGAEARKICLKKITYEYPEEMDAKRGVDMIPTQDTGFIMIMIYMSLFTCIYLVIASTCTAILIRSVWNQGKSTQSTQFLANQRRMTIGVIYFVFMELIGLGIPFLCLSFCFCFNLGTPAVSHYAMISIGFYPIFGPYYVLMSNKDYRNRVSKILKKTNKVTVCVIERHKTI